jgi:hypothetical protein
MAPQPPIRSAERWIYLCWALLVLAYLTLRAASVPWVNDECASLHFYVEKGEFLPYRAHWDANNHVLSSAVGTGLYQLFGLSLVASRVGSLLAFVLFAGCAWLLAARVREAVIRWGLLLALTACPFMLDFFALFRGYAFELAFLLLAVLGLVRLLERWRTRNLLLTLLALLLANASVLALLPTWAALVALLGAGIGWMWPRLGARQRAAQWAVWLLAGGLPVGAAVPYAMELRERGLLYHGGTDGLFRITVGPLNYHVLGVDTPVVRGLLLGLLAAAFLALAIRGGRVPAFVAIGLLGLDVALRVFLALAMDVNYPKDRAALHLVPLGLLAIAYGLDRWAIRHRAVRFAALILLALPLRSVVGANLSTTLLWPEEALPEAFLRAVANRTWENPAVLQCPPRWSLTLPMGIRRLGLDAPLTASDAHGASAEELRITDIGEVPDTMAFALLASAGPSGPHLLERRHPLSLLPVWRGEGPVSEGDWEFLDAWRTDSLGHGDHVVDLLITADSDGRPVLCNLVVDLHDASGANVYYRTYPLDLQRPVWTPRPFAIRARIPGEAGASRAAIYFWQPRHRHARLQRAQIGVSRVADPEH